MEQDVLSSLQIIPAGNVSLSVTSLAVPGPMLVTVIVNTALVPAFIGPFPSLTTETSGQLTTMFAVAELFPSTSEPSFVAAPVAVFVSVPQSAASVAPETITVKLAPGAIVPKLQLRMFPAIGFVQEAAPVPPVIAHATPAGSGSFKVTPVADPVPMLLIVMVKLATSPALIGLFAAVFCTRMFGQLTVTLALAVLLFVFAAASFVAATVTMLFTVPHVADVVGDDIWTVLVA